MAKDFLTDAEMDAMSTPQQDHGDFISDEDMARLQPEENVISDDQMNAMAIPDHGAVNTAVKQAIHEGKSREEVLAIAQAGGVDMIPELGDKVDQALAWRKRHGSYTGDVDLFQQTRSPDVRTAPKNDVSTMDALGTGLYQGATLGFGDEIAAGVGAAANSISNMFGSGTGEGFGEYYERQRDENRDYLHDADDQHAYAYNGGQILGGIAPSLVGAAGATGGRLLARAALEGGVYGAGDSEAESVSGIARDAALGAAVSGATAGVLNRVGATVSPHVAPHVQRLLDREIPLTPGQMLQGGGKVTGFIARNLEDAAKGVGPLSTWATSSADRRVGTALNRGVVDDAIGRDSVEAGIARMMEGNDPKQILARGALDARNMADTVQYETRNWMDAQVAGTAAPRPDALKAYNSQRATQSIDFLTNVPGMDVGEATADNLARKLAASDVAAGRRGESNDLNVRGLIDDAGRVIGAQSVFDSIGSGLTPGLEKFAKLMIGGSGYVASGGATIPLDAAVAGLYSPLGQKIAQRLLTGRQGPMPKAARNIITKLSPLAGVGGAINTPYEEN